MLKTVWFALKNDLVVDPWISLQRNGGVSFADLLKVEYILKYGMASAPILHVCTLDIEITHVYHLKPHKNLLGVASE